ncbi:MAG: hypothetical protein RL041_379 [Bacteroidota bacterium]
MRNQQGVEVMGDGPEEKEGVDIAHRGELLDWIFCEELYAVTQFAARRIFICRVLSMGCSENRTR